MKIWMARLPKDCGRYVCLFCSEPEWIGCTGMNEWGSVSAPLFDPGEGGRLHKALTGEPLPPWPLLSEIEIGDRCMVWDSHTCPKCGSVLVLLPSPFPMMARLVKTWHPGGDVKWPRNW